MRISDWSSDVCSSDLTWAAPAARGRAPGRSRLAPAPDRMRQSAIPTGRFGAPFRFRNAGVPPAGIDRGWGGAQNRQSFYPDKAMQVRPSAIALTPLLLFLTLFFGAGIWFTLQGEPMGFYQLRAPVAILPALALAAWLAHRRGLRALDELLAGRGDSNVVLMCLIFLLAGAFAMVSKAIGAVDAVVALGLGTLPPALILPGLFLDRKSTRLNSSH